MATTGVKKNRGQSSGEGIKPRGAGPSGGQQQLDQRCVFLFYGTEIVCERKKRRWRHHHHHRHQATMRAKISPLPPRISWRDLCPKAT